MSGQTGPAATDEGHRHLMGNRRKQANKRGEHTRAAKQRAALRQRRLRDLQEEVEPLDRFENRFPTVLDAVAAAAAGQDVTVALGAFLDATLRVRATASGPVVECTGYPGPDLRDLLVTAVLNHTDRERAAVSITAALAQHLARFGTFPGIRAICEPTGGPVPRFGWRAEVDVSGIRTWDGFWDLLGAGPIGRVFELTGWDGDASVLSTRAFGIIRTHGLPVVLCQMCDSPLTNGHPMWPGVWTSIDPEQGPVCKAQTYLRGLDDWAEYDRIDVPVGHRPA
jgi:hypothetical protein